MRRSTASYSSTSGTVTATSRSSPSRCGTAAARRVHSTTSWPIAIQPARSRRAARSARRRQAVATTTHGASPAAARRSADARCAVAPVVGRPAQAGGVVEGRSAARPVEQRRAEFGRLGARRARQLDEARLGPLDALGLRRGSAGRGASPSLSLRARAVRRALDRRRLDRRRLAVTRWTGHWRQSWMTTRRAPSPRRMAAKAPSTPSRSMRSVIRRSIGRRPSRWSRARRGKAMAGTDEP